MTEYDEKLKAVANAGAELERALGKLAQLDPENSAKWTYHKGCIQQDTYALVKAVKDWEAKRR